MSAVAYPLNVGGRPFHSWPAFIPVTFETTVLFAAFGAVFGMLGAQRAAACRTTRSSTPRASRWPPRDRFFLCIEAADPKFDLEATRRFLESVNPREVTEVEA